MKEIYILNTNGFMNYILKTGFLVCLFMFTLTGFGQAGRENKLTKKEKKKGWVLLFDGQPLMDGQKPMANHFLKKDGR